MSHRLQRARRRWTLWRERLRERRTANMVYRLVIGFVGTAVLVVGVIAIPYPGPGWAIVFVGLGILATEFDWAKRVLKWVRKRYDRFMAWFHAQPAVVQMVGGLLTTLVVVATLWLLGVLSAAAGVVGVEQDWLNSPLGFGS